MAAVPGSIPDPSPPGRRHFPGRDHVSAKQTNHNESLRSGKMRGICDSVSQQYGNSFHSAVGSFVNTNQCDREHAAVCIRPSK